MGEAEGPNRASGTMRARSGGWGLKRQYSAQGRRNRAEYGGKGATRNFREAVARPQKLSLKDLTATNQIPYPLLPLRRYPNRHQFPRPLQPGQFLGILAIVRAPVSRPSQNQRRSHDYRKGYHDPTPHSLPGKCPSYAALWSSFLDELGISASRACLVATEGARLGCLLLDEQIEPTLANRNKLLAVLDRLGIPGADRVPWLPDLARPIPRSAPLPAP